MAFGADIKRLRGNISAKKIAELIGVDPQRLTKWEQRDANPKDSGDILKIEGYFGRPLTEISNLDKFQFIPHGAISGIPGEAYERSTKLSGINTEVIEKRQSIERSIEILTEDRTRVLSVIERLTTLLENQYENSLKEAAMKQWLELTPPGSPNTETRIPEKFKKKKQH